MRPDVDTETLVLEMRPYEPHVSQRDGQPVYHLQLKSGAARRELLFEITEEELRVLEADAQRYYFLFALLHLKYQHQADAPRFDKLFPRILLGAGADIEALLSREDAASNGGLARHVEELLGHDFDMLRGGQWFQL